MNYDKILELFNECNFDRISRETVNVDVLNNLPIDFKYYYKQGASKVVLIPSNENYVIKLPFKGTYFFFKDNDEKLEKFFIEGLPESHEFDHCAEELRIYHLAKKNGLSNVFLKNIYIGEVKNEPVYIQHKVMTFNEYYDDENSNDEFNNESVHTIEEINAMKDSYDKSPVHCNLDDSKFETWLTDVHSYYGKKFFMKLLQFIDDYVSDLHSDNIGYNGDQPIILDYASFHTEVKNSWTNLTII